MLHVCKAFNSIVLFYIWVAKMVWVHNKISPFCGCRGTFYDKCHWTLTHYVFETPVLNSTGFMKETCFNMSHCSIRRVTHFINMLPLSIVLLILERQKQAPMMGMLVPIITVLIASCHSLLRRPVIWNVTSLWQHCTTLVIVIYFRNWQYCCIPTNWANNTFASWFFGVFYDFFCFRQMRYIRLQKINLVKPPATKQYIAVRTWQWRCRSLQDSRRHRKQLLILQGNFLFVRKLMRIQACAWKRRLQNTSGDTIRDFHLVGLHRRLAGPG